MFQFQIKFFLDKQVMVHNPSNTTTKKNKTSIIDKFKIIFGYSTCINTRAYDIGCPKACWSAVAFNTANVGLAELNVDINPPVGCSRTGVWIGVTRRSAEWSNDETWSSTCVSSLSSINDGF
jgi:hypothetical protein